METSMASLIKLVFDEIESSNESNAEIAASCLSELLMHTKKKNNLSSFRGSLLHKIQGLEEKYDFVKKFLESMKPSKKKTLKRLIFSR
jgi:hypothetical protein